MSVDVPPLPQPAELPRDDEPWVRLLLTDDLRRRRLTVFFRLLLAIPHLILLVLWAIFALLAAIANWFATLVTGRTPAGLQRFLILFVRYQARVSAYLNLVAHPFPPFDDDAAYPVDVQIVVPREQRRLTVLFRFVLAIPAVALLTAIGSSVSPSFGSGGSPVAIGASSGGMIAVAGFLMWFAALATGRSPRGLRDLAAYGIWYTTQVTAYLLIVTDRYPTCDPARCRGLRLPHHPVRMEVGDDGRRSRLLVFFRLALSVPHIVWLLLWSVIVIPAAIANWVVLLVRGRPATPLHRFLAAYVRYQTQVAAFFYVVANPFPGFVGASGYPVDLVIDPPERQRRVTVLFRLLLAIPAAIVNISYSSALAIGGILMWFSGLFLGRVPGGIRNLGAVALRYNGQQLAYALALTGRYPDAGPAPYDDAPEPEPEPAAAAPAPDAGFEPPLAAPADGPYPISAPPEP
ncbi:MAG: DUF4389 domain-containing protein [Gaiella sp.]